MHWFSIPDPPVDPAPPSRRTLWVVGGLVLLHLVLAWLTRGAGLEWGEDDAGYIFLARELRHFSYREIQDVMAPWHARFPPGYPLFIAVFGLPFGDSVNALQGLNALLTGATIVLLFATARRYLGDSAALVTVALFAINPMSLRDSGMVMAEALFKFTMAVGLWGLSREGEGRRYAVLAGGAMIAAALTRSAGISLLPALFLYWVIRGRYRYAAVLTGASVVTVGAWLGWTVMAPDAVYHRLYTADIGIAAPDRSPWDLVAEIAMRIPRRLQRLGTEVFPFVLALPVIPRTIADNVAWIAVMVVCGLTGLVVLLRRWTLAALIIAIYGVLLVLWRYAVERFANPLVPLLHVTLYVGVDTSVRRVAPRWRVPLLSGFVLLLMYGALSHDTRLLNAARRCDRSDPAHSDCWTSLHRTYLAAAQWVRASTPEDAVFFVNKERGFYYHAERRTINQDRTLEEDSLSLGPYLRSRGARYTVATPLGIMAPRHNQLLAAACREFVVLQEFPERTIVLRLREDGDDPGDETACRLLAPYRAAARPRS